MNTLDLIKNSYLLQKGSKAAQEPAVRSLVDKFANSAASQSVLYMASHALSKIDPLSRPFNKAEIATSLDEALSGTGALTRQLNNRFGRIGLCILDSDDPSFLEAMAKVPDTYFSGSSQGFARRIQAVDGLTHRSVKAGLSNALQSLVTTIRHKGSALATFSRFARGESYNSFARLAMAHQTTLLDEPSVSFHRNKDDIGISVLNLREKKGSSIGNIRGLEFLVSQHPLKWFFVFAHELGHAVAPIYQLDDLTRLARQQYGDKSVDPSWSHECYADVYAACLSAKVTGNWDLVRSVILPFRASEVGCHNTFAVCEGLLEVDPHLLRGLAESDVATFAASLTTDLITEHLYQAQIYTESQNASELINSININEKAPDGHDSSRSVGPGYSSRVQRFIDAIAIESAATGVVDVVAVNRAALWMAKIGFEGAASNLYQLQHRPKDERLNYLLSFSNKDVVVLADRLTSNHLAVSYFIDGLTAPPDMSGQINQLCNKESHPDRKKPCVDDLQAGL